MAASLELVALLHGMGWNGCISIEELPYHVKCTFGRDDLGLWMSEPELSNRCGMVRLHVVDYEVVQKPSFKDVLNVLKEHTGNGSVNCVYKDSLLIHHKIGVV